MTRIDSPSDDLRRRISAYPGTLTFHDLIRRNRRDSAVLMVVMVGLAVAVGGIVASAVVAWSGAADFRTLVPSIVLGCVVGLVAAILGAVWSWYGGAGAMLSIVGAREVSRDQDPQLLNVVEELSLAAGLPMPKVYLIPETALNAFATGRDPAHGVVAITTGLRERLDRDELQGVLAHEMAHVRHLDIRFAMLMATMAGLIVFACDAFLRMAFYSGRRGSSRRSGGDKGGGAAMIIVIVVALLLAIIAPLVARIIQMAYSRQREYLADAGAVELTRNPEGLASALQKLAGDDEPLVDTANRGMAHMFIVNPLRTMRRSHQQRSSIFSSHPPIQDRIARLLALAR
ncbi:MAG: M48 family metallopeptidase [Phycisphaerales bacterium]|nr:M48 family metallopeptidase [Phycisphaerales bacterium]